MRRARGVTVAVIAATTAVAPNRAAAQSRLRPLVEAGVATLEERSLLGTTTVKLTGTVFGADGRVRLGPIGLTVGYWQGSLKPAGGGESPDVVEGRVLVGVRPASWLAVQGGPSVRSYVTAAGTQRWLLWRLQARAESELVESRVRSFVGLWQVVSADVNVVEDFDSGRGGEAGLLVRLGRSPLWARLAYDIEQIRLGGGTRLDTVDRLAVGVAVGRP